MPRTKYDEDHPVITLQNMEKRDFTDIIKTTWTAFS